VAFAIFFFCQATTQDEELFFKEFTPFGFVVILPILTNFLVNFVNMLAEL
jgi:hypothetical protein